MVHSYLRFALGRTFGCLTSPTANAVLLPYDNNLLYTAAGEILQCWNIKQQACINRLSAADQQNHPAAYTIAERSALTSPITVIRPNPHQSQQHLIAVGYSNGLIRIFNTKTNTIQLTLNGHSSSINQLIFSSSASNNLLISCSSDTNIIVWDLTTESGLYRLRGHTAPVNDIVLLESELLNHHHIISCSTDNSIRVWDMTAQYCCQLLLESKSPVFALTMDTAESILIAGAAEKNLQVYQIRNLTNTTDNTNDNNGTSNNNKRKLDTSNNTTVNTTTINNSNSLDSTIVLKHWGILPRTSTKRVVSLQIQSHSLINNTDLSSNNNPASIPSGTLLVHNSDKLLELYYIRSSEELLHRKKRLLKRKREKQNNNTNNNTESTAEANSNDSIELQPIDQFISLQSIHLDRKITSCDSIIIQKTKSIKLLLGLADNSLQIYNIPIEQQQQSQSIDSTIAVLSTELSNGGHRTPIRALCLSSDNRLLLSASTESIKVWNISSSNCIRTIETGSAALVACFIPGNRYCVIGTKTGELELFDLNSSDCIGRIAAHSNNTPIYTLQLRPNQRGITTGGADKTVKFWDFEWIKTESSQPSQSQPQQQQQLTLTLTHSLELTDEVLCLAYSPNNEYLAIGLLDSTVRIFYSNSLQFYLALYGHQLPVICIAISSDSSLILTGSADKKIKIWGMEFGDCHSSIRAHNDSIIRVEFIPNTHYAWSISKDNTIKYWDCDRFQSIQTLIGHTDQLWALTVSSDGDCIITAGNDRQIRFWSQTEEQLFIEEERELELEAKLDQHQQQSQSGQVIGELIGSNIQGPAESELVAKSQSTTAAAADDGLKASEKLIEAIELSQAEQARLDKIQQQQQQQQNKQNKSNGKSSSSLSSSNKPESGSIAAALASLTHTAPTTVNNDNTAIIDTTSSSVANPLLFGRTPSEHVLYILQSIPPAQLESALFQLPYNSAILLFNYIKQWISIGLAIELGTQTLLTLLQIHQTQINSIAAVGTLPNNTSNNSSSTTTILNPILLLTELAPLIRRNLSSIKDCLGFNLAALNHLQRELNEQNEGRALFK